MKRSLELLVGVLILPFVLIGAACLSAVFLLSKLLGKKKPFGHHEPPFY